MNILLAGRLGRYADRVLAMSGRGHRLVYCTLPAPTQKPLPDDLKDDSIPRYVLSPGTAGRRVAQLVAEYDIDVVYSMKNVWDGSLELTGEMLDAGVGNVVRHYKEHFCQPSELERRTLTGTAGQIYINEESLAYFRDVHDVDPATAHVLETDFLPARYVGDDFRPKLYDTDHQPHLLVAGGVSVTGGRTDIRELCATMIRREVHVHIYGAKFVGPNDRGVWGVDHAEARAAYDSLTASGYVHLHGHVDPPRFVAEWSGYDAGLLHVAASGGHDEPFQRMNHPNRVSPYVAAGLPLAQQDGRQASIRRMIGRAGIGLVYRNFDDLADQLADRAELARMSERVRAARPAFTYEFHVDKLLDILARYAK